MKAKIKNLTDEILAALAPVFSKHQDYDDILNAMCLVMARVVQASPDKGDELLIMEEAYNAIRHALNEFLKLEQAYEAEQAAKKTKLDEGIAGFNGFARPKQPPIEPGSAADHPDNPNQNLAKTVAPFRDQEGQLTPEGFDQLKKDVIKLHTPDEYTPGEGPYSEP